MKSSSQERMAHVQYNGFRVHNGSAHRVEVVKEHELDPKTFWQKYVSQRKPVLIDGHLSDAGWKASAKWDDDYLRKTAGDAPLMVEKREGTDDSYGKGRKVQMTLRHFLDAISSGSDQLYLSTQEVGPAADGHPDLYTHPLTELAHDFEPVPSLAGHLVPQQMNLWMGASKAGASSGLHHDYHDNIYILLRGRKRFRLYDPSQAPNMYTHGTLKLVHSNGRIVYASQGDVLADGSEVRDVKLWKARVEAEKAVEEAELAVKMGKKGAAKQLKAAQEQLEGVLDAELEDALGMGPDDFDDMEEDLDEGEEEEEEGPGIRVANEENDPPSFSRVNMSLPPASLRKQFPKFPGVDAALECVVEAGQMLYLPAGWFHEVTSFGSAGPNSGHLAFNYWFHPPDHLDASYQGFHRPYTSDYYPAIWRERLAAGMGRPADAGTSGTHVGAGSPHRAPHPHHPFEGVHVDEHDGGTGHTLEIPPEVATAPVAGRSAQKKRKSRAGSEQEAGAGKGKAGKQGGAAPGEEADPQLSEEQKEQLHEQIKAMLMQGLLMRARMKSAAAKKARGPALYKPPRGRRHHAVAFFPRT